jgi:hypothetical protein
MNRRRKGEESAVKQVTVLAREGYSDGDVNDCSAARSVCLVPVFITSTTAKNERRIKVHLQGNRLENVTIHVTEGVNLSICQAFTRTLSGFGNKEEEDGTGRSIRRE